MNSTITSLLPSLRADLGRAKTYVKTVVVAVVSGAAASTGQVLMSAGHEADLFTPAGRTRLLHTFGYGAAVSVIGLFTRSPLQTTINSAITAGVLPPAPTVPTAPPVADPVADPAAPKA
jgi:formate/nitrite transporter FocA (FNT family)